MTMDIAQGPNKKQRFATRRQAMSACLTFIVAPALASGATANGASAGSNEGELARAERLASLCTGANSVGIGLLGEYFQSALFAGKPILTRIDGVIDFDPALDWPAHPGPARALSVHWTGWVKAPMAGQYRFHLTPAMGRVQVSRQLLAGIGASPAGSIELAAGRYYPLDIEIDRLPSSFERLRLEWTAPHGARYVVPRALLHPPTEPDRRPASAAQPAGKI
jgi:hypothetical protein